MSTTADDAASQLVLAPLAVRHVIVPIDGTAHAAAALPTARALASRIGAELSELSFDADEASAAIVTRAAALEPSVVVMGSRARGRLAGALRRSTARDVLRRTATPIVVVGPHADRPPSLVGRSRRRPLRWPEPLSIPRLIAAVDGSPASEEVLPVAAQWASALGMRLAIVTVAEDASLNASGHRSNRFGPDDPEGYVEGLAERWSEVLAGTTGEVVRDPIGPASGLRSHLAVQRAGLVAVATHVRDGLDRFRLGSTSADIVRVSSAPVLVVPMQR